MSTLIGASLIMLTCSVIGLEFAKRLDKRCILLEDWLFILSYMTAEISYNQKPILHICEELAKKTKEVNASFFFKLSRNLQQCKHELFAELWEKELIAWGKKTDLKEKDLYILLQIGRYLGKYDRVNHDKHAELMKDSVKERLTNAYTEKEKYATVYRSFGVLGGMMVILLLL
ncbi:stage III sporulation protein AB [Paenalkalicoccus suaedae]|uniref:Stage III sporulation protein AB n=1 Tax=Paenalkalicoccus suaedae TaxID=2592382 RepID=A0A859FC89_9BACI|nr:stage III sporulation protein AB [Paenalkalicoccus suaedae]QKS70953.1 stage III sporulation protein AB [Paenalkalicoccus suaedae]